MKKVIKLFALTILLGVSGVQIKNINHNETVQENKE